jgi:ABC-2 type transport system permease protein
MAVTFLLSAAVGWLWLGDDGFSFATSDVATSALRAGVYTLLLAWAAGAFTALVRHQTAALVLMFLWPLAIENVLTVVVNVVPALDAVAPLARFLPFNAAARMLRYGDTGGTLFGDPLSPWGGFLVFAAFTGVLMAASLALLHRRDA